MATVNGLVRSGEPSGNLLNDAPQLFQAEVAVLFRGSPTQMMAMVASSMASVSEMVAERRLLAILRWPSVSRPGS